MATALREGPPFPRAFDAGIVFATILDRGLDVLAWFPMASWMKFLHRGDSTVLFEADDSLEVRSFLGRSFFFLEYHEFTFEVVKEDFIFFGGIECCKAPVLCHVTHSVICDCGGGCCYSKHPHPKKEIYVTQDYRPCHAYQVRAVGG